MKVIHSWDTAIKAGKSNDFSVMVGVASHERSLEGHMAEHHIIDIWRGRLEYPQLKRKVMELAQRDKPHAILIEDKASGQSLIQDLRRETSLPIIAILPKGDKLTRFAQVTPMIEAGQVALPHYASWLPSFEQEVLAFPNGAHDDQVDALSQYLNWVREKHYGQIGIRFV